MLKTSKMWLIFCLKCTIKPKQTVHNVKINQMTHTSKKTLKQKMPRSGKNYQHTHNPLTHMTAIWVHPVLDRVNSHL